MATSRARFLKALWAVLLIGTLSLGGLTVALAQDSRIEPSSLGEVPTTGGLRPGPAGALPSAAAPVETGVVPVAIQIPVALVDAQVETSEIVDGVMQDPTGPWVISWYKESPKLGEKGNILMAGHLDYWDVGPSVLYNINNLNQGDTISVTGEDGEIYTYEIDWRENFATADAPLDQIVGPTDNESLTIITCGGPFDYANGVYLERTVVRAHRVETPTS
ncbi:MAG TPA: class F sortase [Thermomicrobiales bacterium]|nr:class F sortase [Thermomicrobiales bacterium]